MGFDEGGMVVAFNFEYDSKAIANVYDSRVFPWALQDVRAFDR